jgi:hypothetical protein
VSGDDFDEALLEAAQARYGDDVDPDVLLVFIAEQSRYDGAKTDWRER